MPRAAAVRRVAIDAHLLTGKHQGSRTWLENVLVHLPALDPGTRYLLYSEDPAATRACVDAPNVEHLRMPALHPVLRLSLFWPWARRRDRFEALLTHYIAPPVGAGRQIVVVYDILFESNPEFFPPVFTWRSRLLVRPSAQRAHRVLTISEFSRGELIARYGVTPERILLAPCAPQPLPVVPPAAPPVGERYVLMVGRIEPRKNVALVMDALDLLARPGLGLVVVGKPDGASAALLARLRERPDARHLQDVGPAELSALYRGAALFAFPSAGEGFGIPVIEALACGTPIVCSDGTAIPEAAGGFARLVQVTAPGAPARLAAAMAEVLDSPPPRDAAAVAAHLRRFSGREAAAAVVEAVHAK
jgi:glycosyltransferase involved in cell wall biosynthesis